MAKVTKHYKKLTVLFTILSLLCVVGPLIFFTVKAFIGAAVVGKIVVSLTTLASIILASVSILFKFHLRSPIFIALIGLWVALDTLLPTIICISITVVLDEFIFSPLRKKYKNLHTINKEIDKR